MDAASSRTENPFCYLCCIIRDLFYWSVLLSVLRYYLFYVYGTIWITHRQKYVATAGYRKKATAEAKYGRKTLMYENKDLRSERSDLRIGPRCPEGRFANRESGSQRIWMTRELAKYWYLGIWLQFHPTIIANKNNEFRKNTWISSLWQGFLWTFNICVENSKVFSEIIVAEIAAKSCWAGPSGFRRARALVRLAGFQTGQDKRWLLLFCL